MRLVAAGSHLVIVHSLVHCQLDGVSCEAVKPCLRLALRKSAIEEDAITAEDQLSTSKARFDNGDTHAETETFDPL